MTEKTVSPKELFETFWDHVKVSPHLLYKIVFLRKELSTMQYQVLITLIEKKYRGKRFIKHWRPISLPNDVS